MLENSGTTNLSEIGEFKLINHLTSNFETVQESTKTSVGDDAAIVKHTGQTVISTDMLVEGIHFDMMYTPLAHLGYKAVTVNLSDIYAMNATPKQITVSIAISSRFTLDAVEELYKGIKLACERYEVDLIGGDTTTSLSGLTISVTAIGEAGEHICYRNGAKNTNLVCVTGDLGSAYLGLQILEREKAIFKENPSIQPDLSGHDYIVERMLKPEARKDVIEDLAELGIKPTSMIDISDGLASELHHLCTSSKTGVAIYDDKLPIDQTAYNTALDLNLPPSTCILNGGEDYELLFTIDLADFEKVKGMVDVTVIGHMTSEEEGLNLVAKDGTQHALEAQGWNHFNK